MPGRAHAEGLWKVGGVQVASPSVTLRSMWSELKLSLFLESGFHNLQKIHSAELEVLEKDHDSSCRARILEVPSLLVYGRLSGGDNRRDVPQGDHALL